MVNCTKCGQLINEGDSFCSSCGAEVVATAQVDLDKTKIEIHKTKRSERIGWGLMVVAIISEGIGGWLVLRNHPDVGVAMVSLSPGMALVLIGGGLGMHSLMRQSRLMRKLEQQETSI